MRCICFNFGFVDILKHFFLTSFFAFLITLSSNSQEFTSSQIIQFSGFVMTSDSLMGIPYAHIFIRKSNKGSISAFDGYFSFAAEINDTVVFSAIGFKESHFVIPDDLDKKKYSVIQLMPEDTVYLAETFVYPWPSREHFRRAFIELDVPDDDLERAKKNLERERLRELGEAMVMDGNESGDYFLRADAKKFYYQGQAPPMQIFNAFAWAKFIQAWKNGDFRRRKK